MFDQSLLNVLCHCRKTAATIVTDSYTTSCLRIERGVLQGDSLSALIFNLLINMLVSMYAKKDSRSLVTRYESYWDQYIGFNLQTMQLLQLVKSTKLKYC